MRKKQEHTIKLWCHILCFASKNACWRVVEHAKKQEHTIKLWCHILCFSSKNACWKQETSITEG